MDLIKKNRKSIMGGIKKAFVIVLAAGLVFTAAACSNSSGSEGETAADETGGFSPKDYSEYMTLGEYSGISIQVAAIQPVTDEDVQSTINGILSSQATTVFVAEGVTQDGDTITLDYTGYLDGVAFEGGTATNASYTVGSNQFIEDLDSQLAGLTVGETYELPCTFPDDYHNADLAGKEVIFEVTVTGIAGESMTPEWNDEFVQEYTQGDYSTAADFEEFIRSYLENSQVSNQQSEYSSALWTQIMDNCEFTSMPEEELADTEEYYVNALEDYYSTTASSYGMTLEDLLAAYGLGEDGIAEEARSMAEQEIQNFMVANMICRAEGLTLSMEEYQSRVDTDYNQSGYADAASFVEATGQDYLVNYYFYQMAQEWALANNVMEEVEETEAVPAGS